jgi:hypothetical protein
MLVDAGFGFVEDDGSSAEVPKPADSTLKMFLERIYRSHNGRKGYETDKNAACCLSLSL